MKQLCVAALFALAIGLPQVAKADAKGTALLLKMEKMFNNYKDQTLKWIMYIKQPGKRARTAKFKVWTRPGYQRLIKLYAPGDVKGMMMLVQSKDEMYIYLPQFRKVRRLAGHVRNQGFLGSGFNYDDMAISRWAVDYSARFVKETSSSYWIDLRKKPGRAVPYYRIKIELVKAHGMAKQMQYFNRRGKHIKTQRFGGYKCRPDKSHCAPYVVTMIAHTRGNQVSQLKCVGLRYDRSLPDRYFTVRHLLRSAR